MVRSDIESGTTESEIRRQQEAIIQASGARAEAVREALEDALAGRPPRYKSRAEP